jgi:hypothetical protein
MAKSRKSNRRTKRVYKRKPRINKKRRLTKRKAGCEDCSPTKLGACAVVAAVAASSRPRRLGPADVGPNPMYEYASEIQAPSPNVMIRPVRPSIKLPELIEHRNKKIQ